MVKRICIYIAVFALTVYCFFLYDDVIVSGLMAAEVFYFFLSMFWLIRLGKKVDVTFERMIPVADMNQKIEARVRICNHSKRRNVHFKAKLQLSNLFTGEKEKCTLRDSVGREGQTICPFYFHASDCGNMTIEVKELILYDTLGIFTLKKKVGVKQKIGILPECHVIPLEVTRRTREFIADAEEYSDRERGDDSSEIYQIREYREKDSIHDIHWKLSAKADELLVKEHGKPLGPVILMWIDMEEKVVRRKKRQGKMRTAALALEAVASLSLSLLEERCVHLVAWYEVENQRIVKKRISKEEHVYELLHRLLLTEPYKKNNQAEELRSWAFKGETFSTTVKFDLAGNITVNDNLCYTLSEERKTEWDKLLLTV